MIKSGEDHDVGSFTDSDGADRRIETDSARRIDGDGSEEMFTSQ